MRKEIKIIIVILVLLFALVGAYYAFTPHYKNINMSGFSLEVLQSNANVVNNTPNYNSYLDTENNLTIKTWSCQSLTDYNGSVEAGVNFANQLMENAGTNVTYNNMTLFNKSGTYTYFNSSPENYSMIIVTSNNLDTLEHIVKTLKQPTISFSVDEIATSNITVNMTSETTLNDTNNTTTNTTKSSTQKTSSASTTKKSSSSNDGYYYSPQHGGYIKEYTDSNGVMHTKYKSGGGESYNPKTNVLTYTDENGKSYDNYMG